MNKVLIFLLAGIYLANACNSTATPKNITVTFPADENCTMQGPIYFLCMTPSANVGALGPLEVK